MLSVKTIDEVEAKLVKYRPSVKQLLGKDMALRRMAPLLLRLGNPEKRLRVVHTAGTSGKTSTSAYTASLLQGAGKKVGLTISPHVDSLTERVQINGVSLSEGSFCEYFNRFMELIEGCDPEPTYFELLMAFALWVFDKEGVDYAVVETGLGGAFDCSNVCRAANKLCIISDIGFDHTKVLGTTLAAIASQKAGIIHPGNTAVMYRQDAEVTTVFSHRCADVGAQLIICEPKELLEKYHLQDKLGHLPVFQRRNLLLAVAAYEVVARLDQGVAACKTEAIEKASTIVIPGRMQEISFNGKTLIFDGAHNLQKMATFLESFRVRYPTVRPSVLISVREKKDFKDVLALLTSFSSEIILTEFKHDQDDQDKKAKLELMKEYCLQKGFNEVAIEPDQKMALQRLSTSHAPIGVVTGSFYLLQQLKKELVS